MTDLHREFVSSLRQLARSPGLSLLAIGTLALGLGANVAIFSLVDAVLFRPFLVEGPDELVRIYSINADDELSPGLGESSYPDFVDYRDESEVLTGVTASFQLAFSLTSVEGASAERLWGGLVDGSYFDLLGVRLPLGRSFTGEEASRGERLMVVSDALFRRRFGSDPSVLGRSVRASGETYTVVGVAPAGFSGLDLDLGVTSPPDFWIPLEPLLDDVALWPFERRDARALQLVGRLRPGVDLDAARAALATQARQLALAYPDTNTGVGIRLFPLEEARFSPEDRSSVVSFLLLLAGGVGFLLLMACANVAALMLVRVRARQREIALRLALGSSRLRIVRHLTMESALLAAFGLLASLPLASATLRLLDAFPLPFAIPLLVEPRLDGRALLFAAILTAITLLLFGLTAAIRGSRPSLTASLRAKETAKARSPFRHLLVGGQAALSLVLLVGAGLFLRTLIRSQTIELGYQPEQVVMIATDLNSESFRYDETRGMRFYRDAVERLGSLPGVREVSWSGDVPLTVFRLIIRLSHEDPAPENTAEWPALDCDIVGPSYFRAMGIPILRGRGFTDADDADSPEVIVINEAMADRYWAGRDPVGRRVKVWGRTGVRTVEIVGVAGNVKQTSLFGGSEPYLYLPLWQRYFPQMNLLARVSGEPERELETLRAALQSLDPELPLFDLRPLKDQVALALSQQRMGAALLGASGLLALLLAAVGIYGATAYSVSERVREMGVRSALGAEPGDLIRLVLRQGTVPAVAGVATGLLLALGLARFLAAFLYGVEPLDPWTFCFSALLLVAVALLACYLPARRVTGIDPIEALRWE